MTSDEAVLAMLDALAAEGIDYMVVGSFSSNLYGLPRSTKDADFVVQFAAKSMSELARRLGPGFRLDPQMSFETVTGTTRYVLDISGTAFKIELFLLSDDPHDQARFARRRPAKVLGREAFVPSAEDVVITKLRWSKQGRRAKDIDDARDVIAVQGRRLDLAHIRQWCDQHDTRNLFEELLREAEPFAEEET